MDLLAPPEIARLHAPTPNSTPERPLHVPLNLHFFRRILPARPLLPLRLNRLLASLTLLRCAPDPPTPPNTAQPRPAQPPDGFASYFGLHHTLFASVCVAVPRPRVLPEAAAFRYRLLDFVLRKSPCVAATLAALSPPCSSCCQGGPNSASLRSPPSFLSPSRSGALIAHTSLRQADHLPLSSCSNHIRLHGRRPGWTTWLRRCGRSRILALRVARACVLCANACASMHLLCFCSLANRGRGEIWVDVSSAMTAFGRRGKIHAGCVERCVPTAVRRRSRPLSDEGGGCRNIVSGAC